MPLGTPQTSMIEQNTLIKLLYQKETIYIRYFGSGLEIYLCFLSRIQLENYSSELAAYHLLPAVLLCFVLYLICKAFASRNCCFTSITNPIRTSLSRLIRII